MVGIRVRDIVKACGGRLLCGNAQVEIKDICINSKEIKEGDLFVPIIGEKVDAHRFIESALEIGAATLTSRHSGVVIADKPYIQVNDTEKALQDIGAYVRSKFNMPFIGVTGSVGKTTTREMISAALSGSFNVYQTAGNFNSQIGVPITLSRITEDAEVSVLEMGMSEEGQMDILSKLVKPDICVVTVIGVAHIEYLKTKENIRKEKLAITNSMNEDGVLFLNGDDKMLAELKGTNSVNTFYYGTEDWCDYRAENIYMENYKYVYDYVHGDKRVTVRLNALGRHNVGNSLVGMAIADYMGCDLEQAAKKFENFQGLRQKLINIPDKYTIIDDTYNASPDSMKASINVLSELETSGKKVAVLGDMFELGDKSEEYHYEIGKFLADKNIDELVAVGELSTHIIKGLEDSGADMKHYSFKDNGEVSLYLMSTLGPDDIALIKASNGMKLIEVVENLCGKQ